MYQKYQYEPLTEQELEILRLKAQRLSNKEIANRLILAVSTVKWYISRIYRKLNVSNRHEAITRADELGLLQTEQAIRRKVFHNLPAQHTAFVGRKKEVDQLINILQKGSRLITIRGTGGIGKTRLALKVAEQLLIEFVDGVYFVPLAPLSTAQDIPTTIAFNINYKVAQDGRSPKQQLLEYLQDRSMLLVIDNFEHVIDGSILISEILSVAPNVVILVTSRKRLNLHSETNFTIRGLSYPKREFDARNAMSYDAIQLFIQSARRANPEFSLNNNVFSIISICKLVDGLPLGIELAARWTDHLSPQDIAVKIQQSMDILQSNYRDMPPRLKSIRVTLAYSWEQLTENERLILARLSIFRGGFTFDSSKHVAQANRLTLRNLTDSSMIRQNPITKRYDMHPLVKQYAKEKLDQYGELQTSSDEHLAYFINMLISYQTDFVGKRHDAIMTLLSDELDNIRAMWEWGVSSHKFEVLSESIPTISIYYQSRSMNSELIKMLRLALDEIRKVDKLTVYTSAEAIFQVSLGTTMATSFGFGAPQVGEALAKAYNLCEKTSNASQKLPVLVGLYNYYHVIAAYQRANEIAHAILDIDDHTSSAVRKVTGHYGISASNLMVGDFEACLSHGQFALQHYKPSMATDLILIADVNLGAFIGYWVALAQQVLGYPEQAQNTIQTTIQTTREGDHPGTLALVLGIMPYVCHVRGDMVSLRQCASQAIKISKQYDLPFSLAQASLFYGYSEARSGNVEHGLAMIDRSMSAFQAIGSAITEGYFRALKAEIFIANDQVESAREELELALKSTEKLNERWYEAELCRLMGEIYQLTNEHDLAKHFFHRAINISQQQNAKWYELRATLSLFNIANDDAIQQFRNIVNWFDEGLDMPDLKRAIAILRDRK